MWSLFSHDVTADSRPGHPHCLGFRTTLRHTTISRNPLYEWSARLTDIYLIIHNCQKWQTSMPLAGFESAFPASERPQTHSLDRPATGIGGCWLQRKTPDDGQRNRPKYVVLFQKLIWEISATSWFYYKNLPTHFVHILCCFCNWHLGCWHRPQINWLN